MESAVPATYDFAITLDEVYGHPVLWSLIGSVGIGQPLHIGLESTANPGEESTSYDGTFTGFDFGSLTSMGEGVEMVAKAYISGVLVATSNTLIGEAP